jgi:hypothetical protein
MKPIRVLAAWLVHFLVLAGATHCVTAAGVQKQIRFARGRTSTVIQQSVLRGDRDEYTLRARAGQKLTLRLSATENNTVFQVRQPGRKGYLKGAGEIDDATRWSGTLPVSGNYTITVGPIRGNATYRLAVSVR